MVFIQMKDISIDFICYLCTRKTGKSCTASSLRILQDGNVAKVICNLGVVGSNPTRGSKKAISFQRYCLFA